MNRPLLSITLAATLAVGGCQTNPEQGTPSASAAPPTAASNTHNVPVSKHLREAQQHVAGKQFKLALASYEAVTREQTTTENEAAALFGRVKIHSNSRSGKLRNDGLARGLTRMLRDLAEKDNNPILFELADAADLHQADQKRISKLRRQLSAGQGVATPEESGAGDESETVAQLQAKVAELEAELAQKEAALQRLKELTIGR